MLGGKHNRMPSMSMPFDPFIIPRSYWQSYGWLFGSSLAPNHAAIGGMHRWLLAHATALRPINPRLASFAEEMAAEFHGAALNAFAQRPPPAGRG